MVFITLVLVELVNAFNCRSDYLSAFKVGLFQNRFLIISLVLSLVMMVAVIEWEPLARLFHTTPLRWQDWLLAAVLSLLILPVVEAAKWWLREKVRGKRGKWRNRGMVARASRLRCTDAVDGATKNAGRTAVLALLFLATQKTRSEGDPYEHPYSILAVVVVPSFPILLLVPFLL